MKGDSPYTAPSFIHQSLSQLTSPSPGNVVCVVVNTREWVAHLTFFWQVLIVDEQLRAQHFHFASDRQRYVITRGLLRFLISHYIQENPRQITFIYNPYGKPGLAQLQTSDPKPTLQFNVAHSGDYAFYAFTLGCAAQAAIGSDIEQIRALANHREIADYILAAQEKSIFQRLTVEQQMEMILYCWTCKEAYLKALGVGLSTHIQPYSVDLVQSPDMLGAEGWLSRTPSNSSIYFFKPTPHLMASVSVPGGSWNIQLVHIRTNWTRRNGET